jgi:hypothetical protein
VDPRAGLDDVEKRKFLHLPGLELRPLGRAARSQSLYNRSIVLMTGRTMSNIKYVQQETIQVTNISK